MKPVAPADLTVEEKAALTAGFGRLTEPETVRDETEVPA
jgi:hypothetical protein